ncbi:hypothetical protein GCM10027605_17000 [Micromonospora zhanjiangensis]
MAGGSGSAVAGSAVAGSAVVEAVRSDPDPGGMQFLLFRTGGRRMSTVARKRRATPPEPEAARAAES